MAARPFARFEGIRDGQCAVVEIGPGPFARWEHTHRTIPDALLNSGFSLAYPHLEPALRHLPGRM